MNTKPTSLIRPLGLLIMIFALSGCNTTNESGALTLKEASPLNADYILNKHRRETENALIAKLRRNAKDLDAVFELAKLRDSAGQNRLARNGFRQVVKATAEATPKNESMKAYAAKRLAILRSDSVDRESVPTLAYRF